MYITFSSRNTYYATLIVWIYACGTESELNLKQQHWQLFFFFPPYPELFSSTSLLQVNIASPDGSKGSWHMKHLRLRLSQYLQLYIHILNIISGVGAQPWAYNHFMAKGNTHYRGLHMEK